MYRNPRSLSDGLDEFVEDSAGGVENVEFLFLRVLDQRWKFLLHFRFSIFVAAGSSLGHRIFNEVARCRRCISNFQLVSWEGLPGFLKRIPH